MNSWKYQINDSHDEMDVWDHNGTKIDTVQKDGFQIPQDVKTVMAKTAQNERKQNGQSDYYIDIMAAINFDAIEAK